MSDFFVMYLGKNVRISTGNQAAEVQIRQPANPAFPVQTYSIPANSTQTLEFGTLFSYVENAPANQVLNKGFLITSTTPVSVYYEVLGNCQCNPEIFTLKGKNALGKDFYIPFQNTLSNGNSTIPNARGSFDIVASEDNTIVTIIPTANIVGHLANIPFTINLNKGQTWSGTLSSPEANLHATGTKVTSNSPIAITLSDDLLSLFPCLDLAGDQIVPTTSLGTDLSQVKNFEIRQILQFT